QSSFIPPDPMGDVGPSQILVHVNGRIKVFSKSGTLGALNSTANSFWTSTRNGSGVTDPQIRYDRLSNRWYVIAANTPATDNRIMVAYQTTPGGTITGSASFTFTFFVATSQGDAGCYADFPTLAVDQ